jgi:aspartokinase
VSVTVDNAKSLDDIAAALSEFAEVECEPQMAIVSIVGETLNEAPGVFAKAIVALGDIPLRLVSQAASRRNVTFVLREQDVTSAMTRLHDAFFENA